jgi:GNAT superfamily N-acetyltransferase
MPTIQKHVADETIWAGERSGELVATLRLTDSKIGFYRSAWFGDPKSIAGYLMHMAVSPHHQGLGYGTALLREAEEVALKRGLECVRLDSYDAPAGAGSFYEKAGYTHVHSGEVHGVPLLYWEKFLQ